MLKFYFANDEGLDGDKSDSQKVFLKQEYFCTWLLKMIEVSNGSSSLHIIEKINRKVGLIEDVVVFKKFRGKSVASSLVNQLISISKKEGCYKTILNTDSKTKSFYRKIRLYPKKFSNGKLDFNLTFLKPTDHFL